VIILRTKEQELSYCWHGRAMLHNSNFCCRLGYQSSTHYFPVISEHIAMSHIARNYILCRRYFLRSSLWVWLQREWRYWAANLPNSVALRHLWSFKVINFPTNGKRVY